MAARKRTASGKKKSRAARKKVPKTAPRMRAATAKGAEQETKRTRTSRRADSVLSLLLDEDGGIPLLRTREDADSVRSRLQNAAIQWSYVVRNRKRWAGSYSLGIRQEERARKLLAELQMSEAQLLRLAKAGIVQVSVAFEREDLDWEGRLLPWEFLLTSATRSQRSGSPLTVIRQLRRRNSPNQPVVRRPESVLFVESAPGPLDGLYTFDSEVQLVRTNLKRLNWYYIKNPTREALANEIRIRRPDAIHLAGFGTHEAMGALEGKLGRAKLMGRAKLNPASNSTTDQPWLQDGYVLATEQGGLDPVGAAELAALLTSGNHRPQLVGCGFWNSASRVAALAVAAGVGAVAGFQDSFEDDLVEVFFAAFYRHWNNLDGDVRSAFTDAWTTLRRRSDGLLGTGVVLWSDAALVGQRARGTQAAQHALVRKRERLEKEEGRVLDPTRFDREELEKLVTVKVQPFEELNYSLLHNRQPLFKTFEILKLQPGRMMDVNLNVDLCVGSVSFPFRRSYELRNERPDLSREIHSALTASLVRSLRESVSTSLLVEVTWGPHLLHRDTHRVRLLPADQWRDNDTDRIWLPSFVLPRDPAVVELLERAQHYVRVLRDDPSAGFDGYQSVDPERDDPTEDVDLQVQAIWSALVHEWRLGYVNPPPTYSAELDSQRLRTPSTVRRDSSGTCIDLSLLLAACLELVDIYPVIFLLEGHAFPGYWRTHEAHERFLEVWLGSNGEQRDEPDPQADRPPPQAGFAGTRNPGWSQGRASYPEIVRQIDEGNLVPIESVQLTQQCGFWEAVEAGQDNLKPRREFHSMLDIITARTSGVTPLPLWEGEV
jgi:hypothetical protein